MPSMELSTVVLMANQANVAMTRVRKDTDNPRTDKTNPLLSIARPPPVEHIFNDAWQQCKQKP